MKFLVFFLLCSNVFFGQIVCDKKPMPREVVQKPTIVKDSIKIKYGVSSGKCHGYCNREIKIISDSLYGAKIWHSLNPKNVVKPNLTIKSLIKKETLENIVTSTQLDVFCNLPKKIGCPGCSDGGVEWLEISCKGNSKRVMFDYGTKIKGLNELLSFFRSLEFKL